MKKTSLFLGLFLQLVHVIFIIVILSPELPSIPYEILLVVGYVIFNIATLWMIINGIFSEDKK